MYSRVMYSTCTKTGKCFHPCLSCCSSTVHHIQVKCATVIDYEGYNDIYVPIVTLWYSATIWQLKEWLFFPHSSHPKMCSFKLFEERGRKKKDHLRFH